MSDIASTLAFGILALLILFVGLRKGFFEFHPHPWFIPIRLIHIIGAFAIYFIGSSVLSRVFIGFWQKKIMLNYLTYASWLNFGLSFLIFILLAIYFLLLPKSLRMGILRRPSETHRPIEDLWAAIYAWILAFPLVLFLSQILEFFLTKILQVEKIPEQIAVKFLKSTFEDPTYFTLAVLSITILAPLIEETLFRGFLQSFIRQHLGPKQAILITSVCFSFFHYSSGQGMANISIIFSLFVLALFLGFLYEKKGSLLAPILLHAAFNTVSVINLYLFGGFTSGI